MNIAELKMHDNVFVPGQKFLARVKIARSEGVYVEMPHGGSGIVNPKCWGKGAARAAAIARVSPGDRLMVRVVSWLPAKKQLHLVICGAERTKRTPRSVLCVGGRSIVRKPAFKPLPASTLIAVDTANYIGKVAPEHASAVLEKTAEVLRGAGYKTIFFLEQRTLTWLLHHQKTESAQARLTAFSKREDVVCVKAEADFPILQLLESEENSCAVSADRFEDYMDEFPEIVGSERIHGFTVFHIDGKLNISIDGVRSMVSVPLNADEASSKIDTAHEAYVALIAEPVNEDEAPSAGVVRVLSHASRPSARDGALEIGRRLAARGSVEAAIRVMGKAAKDDPEAYFALAEMYERGACVKPDAKVAAKYRKLGRRLAILLCV